MNRRADTGSNYKAMFLPCCPSDKSFFKLADTMNLERCHEGGR